MYACMYVCMHACMHANPTNTKPKERFMTKAKSHSAYDPRAIHALCARQNYKLASRK